MSVFNAQEFKQVIQTIVDQNPDNHNEIYDALAGLAESLSTNDPMLGLKRMASTTSFANTEVSPSSMREVNGVNVLTKGEREEIMQVLVEEVTEAGEILWQFLRHRVSGRISWLTKRQKDPEATLRTWCNKLFENGKLEHQGEMGKSGPVNNTMIRLSRNTFEGDANPFNGSGHALALGTRSVARSDIEITLDGGSKEAKAEGNGNLSHRPNGSQNEPNTLALIDRNSASAEQ